MLYYSSKQAITQPTTMNTKYNKTHIISENNNTTTSSSSIFRAPTQIYQY